MGELDIENRTDRVTLKGDVVPTKDQAGLAILSDKSLEPLSDWLSTWTKKLLAERVSGSLTFHFLELAGTVLFHTSRTHSSRQSLA